MNQTNSILFRKERLWVLALAAVVALTTAFFLSTSVVRAADGDTDANSITQLDTNNNGKINRITFGVDNAAAGTWELNGSAPYGVSVTDGGSGVTVSAVSLTTSATADPVGIQVDLDESDGDLSIDTSAAAVELIYTQVTGNGSCTNCIRDNGNNLEFNAVATGDTDGTDTEADGAAPVLHQFGYEDNDNDGQIDQTVAYFSETVTAASVLAPDDLTLTNVGDFTALAFGSSTTDTITGSVTEATVVFGTESTAVDTSEDSGSIAISTQNGFSLTDGTNTNTTLGALSSATFLDEASPILTDVTIDVSSGYNIIEFDYSENMTLDNGAASTSGRGALTSAGTIAGLGDFATNGDAITNNAVSNTITVSTNVITVTFNNQSGNYFWTTGSTTAPSGNVTPLAHADINDGTNQVNTSAAAVTPVVDNAWDITKPSVSSITISDADNDGSMETATLVFSESVRDSSITDGDADLGDTGTTTGTFATGTANDDTTVFTRTDDNEANNTDGDDGDEGDFTYDAATTSITDLAGNLLDTTTDGTIVTADVTEVDGANPIVVSVTKSSASNRNRLSILYSENVTVTDGASTSSSGDMTTAGTIAGFGSFATTGDATVPTTKNTVGGSGTATITIDLADQAAGTIVTAATPGTEVDGAFTPVAAAAVVDAASNQVATTATSDTAGDGTWDLTRPTISSVTISDASGDNGKIDQAVLVLSEAMRDANVTDGDGLIGGQTGTFTTGTANDATTTFNLTSDAALSVDTSADGVDFTYTGATTLLTDLAGNLVDTTTDGTIVDDDVVQTDSASPIVTNVTLGSDGTYNTFLFDYSENMTVADGATTSVLGDFTVAGTVDAFGTFATAGNAATNAAADSTISGSGSSTITIQVAAQTAGYLVSASTTEPSGVFTPISIATVVDGASNQVNVNNTPTASGGAWDLTKPGVTISVSDADDDGRIDTATLEFDEDIRDNSITNGDAALSSTSGTTTGTFATGTANDGTTVFSRGADDAAVDTALGTETDFTYSGGTTLIRDLAGNLYDGATDGQIASGDETEVDEANPIMSAATTLDDDGDGQVDMFVVTWSESIDDSTFDNTQDSVTTFTLSGSLASPTSVSDTTDDATSYIGLTESGSSDTDSTDTYVDAGGTIDDIAGNASPGESQSVTDGAAPAITAITTADTNADGTVDQLTLTFSESVDITDTNGPADGFPGFDGLTDSCSISNQDLTSNGVTSKAITVGSCTSSDTGITVELSYNSGDANTDISDESAATNEMTDNETIASGTDGASPVLLSATYRDDDANGTVDQLRTTWSEAVTVDADGACNDFVIVAGGLSSTCSDVPTQGSASATYDVTITATSNITGTGSAPTINYVTGQQDPVSDAASNLAVANGGGAVTATDAAPPVILSGVYSSSDADGEVDEYILTTSTDTGMACTAFDGDDDVSVGTAGEVTLAVNNSDSCATNGTSTFTISLATDGATSTTGGATAPVITYTQPGNGLEDGAGNDVPTKASLSLSDQAVPIILSGVYGSAGADGEVDQVVYTTSADTGITCTAFTGGTDFTVGTAGTVTLAENASDTCASNGTSTVTISLATDGATNTTGGGTAPIVTYTQPGNGIEDGAGNDLQTDSSRTLADGAPPIILSGVYGSAGADGEVDQVVYTTSADTGMACTAFTGGTDFTVGTAGTVTLAEAGGDTCATNGTSTFTISLATDGATNTTGGATAPVVTYTQPGDGLEDGAGNDVPTDSSRTLSDGAPPIILSGVYGSADEDGEIDQVVYTTSADTGMACTAFTGGTDFTVGTAGTVTLAEAGGDTCATNGTSTFTISLATDGATNTTGGGTDPIVTYTQPGNGLEDGAGNDVPTDSSRTLSDAAGPVVVSRTTNDNDADGQIDQIVVVYSEDLNGSSVAGGDYTVTGFTVASATETSAGTTTVVLTESGSYDTGATPTVTSGAGIRDLNSNDAILSSLVAATDGARPILVSASPSQGGQLLPASSNFSMTFSEDLDDATVTTSTMTATPSSGATPTVTPTDSSGTVTMAQSSGTFNPSVTITVTVRGDTGEVADSAGNLFDASGTVFGTDASPDATYTFTTLNPSSGGGGGGGGGGGSVSVVSDAVTVTSPNGGEQLTGGAQHDITWTSTGNIDNVVLYYSVDGGSTFGLIAAGTNDDGSYTWTVPNTATSQGIVKIVGRDSGGATLSTDQSNSSFIINTDSALPVEDAPAGSSTAVPDGVMSRVDAEAALPGSIDVDDLVRVADDGDPTTDFDTTVYYIGLDAKRHPFPSSQVFFTWYENFDAVRTIDTAILSEMPLGSPVLTRPGTMMVKIQSDARTFAVEPGDYTIRWVPTEEAAIALFGSTWNQRIMDIEPTYWSRFTMGSDLTADLHPAGTVLQSEAGGTKYYFDGIQKRAFSSAEAFAANMFQDAYVITAPSSTGWMDTTEGPAITGFEDGLFSLQR